MRDEVTGPGELAKQAKEKLLEIRKKCVEFAFSNDGVVDRTTLAESTVFHEVSDERHAINRGKTVTVRRYKEKMGKSPPKALVFDKKYRNGKVKPSVQMYADSDSSQESFEERTVDRVSKRTKIDDNKMELEEGALDKVFANTRKAVLGEKDCKRKLASLKEMKLQTNMESSTATSGASAKPPGATPLSPATSATAATPTKDTTLRMSQEEEDDAALECQRSRVQSTITSLAKSGAMESKQKAAPSAKAGGNDAALASSQTACNIAAKAKGKAKAKGSAKAKVIKPDGVEAARTQIKEAHISTMKCLKTFLEVTDFKQLVALEDAAKIATSQVKGIEDTCVALDADDLLVVARFLANAVPNANSLLRGWKAYQHASNDKNKNTVQMAWVNFRESVIDAPQVGGSPKPVLFTSLQEIVKGTVISFCNKLEYAKATESVSMQVLSGKPWLATTTEADQLQVNFAPDVFKKLTRKYHQDPPTLATTWKSSLLSLGEVNDPSLNMSLSRLTPLIDYESRETADIKLGYSYAMSKKGDDPFVKTICLVAAKIITNAIQATGGDEVLHVGAEENLESELQA